MPSRFCEIYSLASAKELAEAAFRCLEAAGYSLYYPNTQEVCIWREGGQVRLRLDEFLDIVSDHSQPEMSFQMWLASGHDIVCCRSIRKNGVTLMIWMDGFSVARRLQFIQFFLKAAQDESFPKSVGLIVDLNETALPDEWEQFFFSAGACPKLSPDIVGVKRERCDRFKHQHPDPIVTELGEYIVYSWVPLAEIGKAGGNGVASK